MNSIKILIDLDNKNAYSLSDFRFLLIILIFHNHLFNSLFRHLIINKPVLIKSLIHIRRDFTIHSFLNNIKRTLNSLS